MFLPRLFQVPQQLIRRSGYRQRAGPVIVDGNDLIAAYCSTWSR
jgi:hypothetical protein